MTSGSIGCSNVSGSYLRQVVVVELLGNRSAALRERVDDDKVVGFLELHCRVPHLVSGHLLLSLFDEAAVEPEVEG